MLLRVNLGATTTDAVCVSATFATDAVRVRRRRRRTPLVPLFFGNGDGGDDATWYNGDGDGMRGFGPGGGVHGFGPGGGVRGFGPGG
ncbi:hypothetical protein PsYK624_150620 [Phanerochaete sordida]|uniref:Uncharacterized protein n=1 Tax=Phanerochaete sordida TaxID=48140 RepID=A0A9P3GNN9_9APHY|nr:hypothetical protein PsYK624_150620 [Phanerochaete sordida]